MKRGPARKQRLLWQLFTSFLVITVVALVLVMGFATTSFREFHRDQTLRYLETSANLIRPQIEDLLTTGRESEIDQRLKEMRRTLALRITVVRNDGQVVGESDLDLALLGSHKDRPEIVDAIRAGRGVSTRFSASVNQRMMYFAMPLFINDQRFGVVRTSQSLENMDRALWRIQSKIAAAWFAVALIAGVIILTISRRISQPFDSFRDHVLRYGEDPTLFSALPSEFPTEFEEIARAMNQMASRLDERSGAIQIKQREEEAILSSMTEALLAVDQQGRVLKVNGSMAKLFHIDPSQAQGHSLQEVVRNQDLNRFVNKVLENDRPISAELSLFSPERLELQSHGARIRDPQGRAMGAVIVLNDVTRLKRLETMRREFVANVSHELRTPITSIQGFIETLQDGAIQDPEAAEHFLGIIARQADRLNQIIEDLLSLSRIEQNQDSLGLELVAMPLIESLQSAITTCSDRAAAKQLRLVLDCPPGLVGMLHETLFQQALINLIDNAIKYSEPEREVKVRARQGDSLIIEVEDQGHGIGAEHHDRIFERFYRVDKARSRDMGGTGLGLSIVKHIAQAHKGFVEMESTPEKGSTFRLVLPKV